MHTSDHPCRHPSVVPGSVGPQSVRQPMRDETTLPDSFPGPVPVHTRYAVGVPTLRWRFGLTVCKPLLSLSLSRARALALYLACDPKKLLSACSRRSEPLAAFGWTATILCGGARNRLGVDGRDAPMRGARACGCEGGCCGSCCCGSCCCGGCCWSRSHRSSSAQRLAFSLATSSGGSVPGWRALGLAWRSASSSLRQRSHVHLKWKHCWRSCCRCSTDPLAP